VFSKFATTWTNPHVNPNPTNLQAQIAKPTSLSNDDAAEPFVFNPTITYEYEDAFETMVSESHSFEWGAEVSAGVEYTSRTGAFKRDVHLNLSFKCTGTWSNSTATTNTGKYSISDQLQLTVPANQTNFVSMILYADKNATVELIVHVSLQGVINGETVTGTYLRLWRRRTRVCKITRKRYSSTGGMPSRRRRVRGPRIW